MGGMNFPDPATNPNIKTTICRSWLETKTCQVAWLQWKLTSFFVKLKRKKGYHVFQGFQNTYFRKEKGFKKGSGLIARLSLPLLNSIIKKSMHGLLAHPVQYPTFLVSVRSVLPPCTRRGGHATPSSTTTRIQGRRPVIWIPIQSGPY